jgi:carboxyl-terminal processing protease
MPSHVFLRLLRSAVLTVAVVAIFGAGFLAGTSRQVATAQDDAATQTLFEPFWEAWDTVHRTYVDIATVSDEKLMEGAISGMVNAIGDRNTAYMDAQAFESLNTEMSGSFEGIGANVRKDETTGGLEIVSTIAGSPARELLKRGDIIVTVDGEDVTALSEMEIIGKVRGPAGTPVTLGIVREGERKLLEIEIVRARIEREVVVADVLEGDIGYIKLNDFTSTAPEALEKALKQVDVENAKGLIIDLRDDPGGFLREAIDITSAFIKRGTVVIQRGRPGTREIKYPATGDLLVPETIPVVVLINEGSASASELFSGALQDYKRAVIVGTTSFGKGSVQAWSELSNGGALRITSSYFFTPLGRKVNGVGIVPDVVVEWPVEDQEKNPDQDPQLEKALELLREGKVPVNGEGGEANTDATAEPTAEAAVTATPAKKP